MNGDGSLAQNQQLGKAHDMQLNPKKKNKNLLHESKKLQEILMLNPEYELLLKPKIANVTHLLPYCQSATLIAQNQSKVAISSTNSALSFMCTFRGNSSKTPGWKVCTEIVYHLSLLSTTLSKGFRDRNRSFNHGFFFSKTLGKALDTTLRK